MGEEKRGAPGPPHEPPSRVTLLDAGRRRAKNFLPLLKLETEEPDNTSSRNMWQGQKPMFPRILGHEAAGTKRSILDKCRLPVGIRLFVSAGHSESDIQKVSDSLRRVAAMVLSEYL